MCYTGREIVRRSSIETSDIDHFNPNKFTLGDNRKMSIIED